MAGPQPGERGHLQHLLVSTIRAKHYSRRTEQAYWHWTRQYVLWSGKRHPLEMGAPEIGAFLTWLATERKVSASTQRQDGSSHHGRAAPPPDPRHALVSASTKIGEHHQLGGRTAPKA